MSELPENIKKLIEKKYAPSDALSREITEKGNEIIATVQDTASTLNDEIRGSFERLESIIDAKLDEHKPMMAEMMQKMDEMKEMEIEIEIV